MRPNTRQMHHTRVSQGTRGWTLNHRVVNWATVGVIVTTLLVASTGCSRRTQAAGTMPPPEVEVVSVVQKDVPIYSEWIGTLDGLVNADIKAQVSGYLLKQAYTEGSFVQNGQVLFQIDTEPFQPARSHAQAQL